MDRRIEPVVGLHRQASGRGWKRIRLRQDALSDHSVRVVDGQVDVDRLAFEGHGVAVLEKQRDDLELHVPAHGPGDRHVLHTVHDGIGGAGTGTDGHAPERDLAG